MPPTRLSPSRLFRSCSIASLLALCALGGCQASLPPLRACEVGAPDLFVADLLSTASAEEWAFSFDPAGTTMLLQRGDFKRYTLYQTQLGAHGWSAPVPQALSRPDANDSDAFITPDGRRLFCSTNRAAAGGIKGDFDIWVAERVGQDGWSAARPLGPAVNPPRNEWLPSVAANGNLYFESGQEGGKTHWYRARFRDGAGHLAQVQPVCLGLRRGGQLPVLHQQCARHVGHLPRPDSAT